MLKICCLSTSIKSSPQTVNVVLSYTAMKYASGHIVLLKERDRGLHGCRSENLIWSTVSSSRLYPEKKSPIKYTSNDSMFDFGSNEFYVSAWRSSERSWWWINWDWDRESKEVCTTAVTAGGPQRYYGDNIGTKLSGLIQVCADTPLSRFIYACLSLLLQCQT